MFLAAFASLRFPESKTFYDRKRAEGKRHNAALICLGRRRCNVILAILRTGQHYLTPDQRAAHPDPHDPLTTTSGHPPGFSRTTASLGILRHAPANTPTMR